MEAPKYRVYGVEKTNFLKIGYFHDETTRISTKNENLLRLEAPKYRVYGVEKTDFFEIGCFHGETTRISTKIENLHAKTADF